MKIRIERVISVLVLGILAYYITVKGIELLQFNEGFISETTRASDCRCLPGYIPSNTVKNSVGGRIIRRSNGGIFWNPAGTKDIYWFSSCNQCGVMNICDPKIYENVSESEFSKFTFKGGMNDEICKKWKETIKTGIKLDTFFCQNLSDSKLTKKCY